MVWLASKFPSLGTAGCTTCSAAAARRPAPCIARGYHHELMVKSRQGLETSTRQGWHTGGIAAYGYRFATHAHPNPHKARQGALKRTLEVDPVRAPVVRKIYDLYLSGTVGLTQIRDILNADLDAHPPPAQADPARSLGVWSRSSLWAILRNPVGIGAPGADAVTAPITPAPVSKLRLAVTSGRDLGAVL